MGQHLIHSQKLDLRYRNATQAKGDMDQWSEWYQRELLPVMSEVFDELEIPGKTVRLEKLVIDLGRIPGKPDPEALKRKLREALRNQILRQIPELARTDSMSLDKAKKHPKSPDGPKELGGPNELDVQKELEQLAYLLEKGRQPWWALPSKKAGIRHFLQKLFREKSPAFKKWLESQPLSSRAAQRLSNHLSDAELTDLVAWVFPESARIWELFCKSLNESLIPEIFEKPELEGLLSKILAETFFVANSAQISAVSTWLRSNVLISPRTKIKSRELILPVLELLCEKKSQIPNASASAKIIQKWLESPFVRSHSEHPMWSEKQEKHQISEEFQKELAARFGRKAASQKEERPTFYQKTRSIQELNADETFPVFNAGLVLTAPFLPYFFRGLGLVEKNEFVSAQAQHRAALLIQSLLDDSFVFEESDLLLNKILCGIPPDEPIPVGFSPTELEKEEIQNLLDAMAGQWTALKSTSGRNLAKGFFPREGSLRRADKGYRLHIPRISIDILLNRLPWTISIIKLPWMNETLFTEW